MKKVTHTWCIWKSRDYFRYKEKTNEEVEIFLICETSINWEVLEVPPILHGDEKLVVIGVRNQPCN